MEPHDPTRALYGRETRPWRHANTRWYVSVCSNYSRKLFCTGFSPKSHLVVQDCSIFILGVPRQAMPHVTALETACMLRKLRESENNQFPGSWYGFYSFWDIRSIPWSLYLSPMSAWTRQISFGKREQAMRVEFARFQARSGLSITTRVCEAGNACLMSWIPHVVSWNNF